MKTYRGADGQQRIWFEKDEIESIMEDELRKAELYPSADPPIVDLERFIERHLKVRLDQHAELDFEVLGVTNFEHGRKPRISINANLSDMAYDVGDLLHGTLGRWRATLAHEASHVLLHAILFESSDVQGELWPDQVAVAQGSLLRCLKRDLSFTATTNRRSDWREVQANRGMASLLMPKGVFHEVARRELSSRHGDVPPQEGQAEAEAMVTRLANVFQVSRQAARIRLSDLGYIAAGHTISLLS